MAGKVDSATHAAAIAKISEAVKHEGELRAHLEEIIKGAAFKGSHRSQAFLKYIVEQALHGDPADLRERSIGVALFGRPATYDTADDAIVRVTASDVRKRLLQHYGNVGGDSKFRINLPAGSYVPEFCFLPAPPVAAPAESGAATSHVVEIPSPPAPAHEETRADPRPRKRRVPVVAAVLVLCLAGFGWWAVGRALDGANNSLIVAAFQDKP